MDDDALLALFFTAATDGSGSKQSPPLLLPSDKPCSAEVRRDKKGKSRSFGFVSFSDAAVADRACLAVNGTMLPGHGEISVKHYR
jgi:hypothetical protein